MVPSSTVFSLIMAQSGCDKLAVVTCGALQFAAYALVIWAMTLGPMASVSALRETSVIFAAFIGAFVLKERLGRLRIAAAILVALGIVLMRIADI